MKYLLSVLLTVGFGVFRFGFAGVLLFSLKCLLTGRALTFLSISYCK